MASSERSIPQRELRNDSSRILREVREGATFVVTNNGEAVGRLSPIDGAPSGLRIRSARRRGGWVALKPARRPSQPLEEILDALRSDRA